jgi:glycosyltransferase involved in cell wall biosynthesis
MVLKLIIVQKGKGIDYMKHMDGKNFVIAVTNFYFPTIGGISTYIHSLHNELIKKGIDTKIVQFPLKFRKLENALKNKYLKKTVHVSFVVAFIAYTELLILRYKITQRRIVVHSHSASFCLVASALSKVLGTKVVHTFHSPSTSSSRILEYFSPMVDALIFVSKATQEQYQKHSKIKNKNILIIPGGVDDVIFYPRNETECALLRQKYKDKIGVCETDKLILFVGRVVEDKGVLPLVKSIAIAKEQIPNVKLIIVGPYNRSKAQIEFYQRLKEVIVQLHLNESIFFAGVVSNEIMIDLYALCDISVCPSIWQEPLGIVVLEAMASGKPVIATNAGGLPHLVTNGKTGYIVEANNHIELATKMIELLRNDELRIRMGDNARVYAEQFYSIKVMTDKYMQLYNQLFE